MMQSCRHYRKACFSCVHDFQPHPPILILAGDLSYQTQQSIVYMRVRGIVSLLPHAIGITGALPGQRERSRPKYYVTEGVMTSAEDMRPEATLLIGLSYYALQCQTRILYELTRQVVRWHSIGWSPTKSMTQA
jgi:hypothetical protein